MQFQKNDLQDAYQRIHEILKLDHIFHNKSLIFFSTVLSRIFKVINAYKDPVENPTLNKMIHKIITRVFVISLGSLQNISLYLINTNP